MRRLQSITVMVEDLLSELWILKKLGIGLLLSALIGLEREVKNRPAGLRTHALVGLTATLLVALGDVFAVRYQGDQIQLDPMRTLEALATGVAFIGGGTIFISRGGKALSGLTTAATLLLVTAIGITVGLDKYVWAISATALGLAVLRLFKILEKSPLSAAPAGEAGEGAIERRPPADPGRDY